MNKRIIPVLKIGALVFFLTTTTWSQTLTPDSRMELGKTDIGAVFSATTTEAGWGLKINGVGLASASQTQPFSLEFDQDAEPTATGYDSIEKKGEQWLCQATLERKGAVFSCKDLWSIQSNELCLKRTVTVTGSADGGFLSGVQLKIDQPLHWTDVEWFAPGMIYGGFDGLTAEAIGGRAFYKQGNFTVRIREDRLPAPLFSAYFSDNTSLSVLNPAPRGDTTSADSHDLDGQKILIDERFQFGAIGAEEHDQTLTLGYWFPGTEGEVTYKGNTYPHGQFHHWRKRYHPIKDGLEQQYEVVFRISGNTTFAQSFRDSWRWAWKTMEPQVTPHPIDEVRRYSVNVLLANTIQMDGRTGIPFLTDACTGKQNDADYKALLGFCGKNLEAAYYLLREAALDQTQRGQKLQNRANAIIDTFTQLKVDPPSAEGFYFKTGKPAYALPDGKVYLRSYGDDIKALLRAYRFEKNLGSDHPNWLAWCQKYADWLLTQEHASGGFPRSWEPNGRVLSASPNASFNAIGLLVLLSELTQNPIYLDAAIRTGNFCWSSGQSAGTFVGGTIDNPDVLDKEAATLSMEAYLMLHEATKEAKWIERAQAAADFSESWIYLWNVPMPADENDAALNWKKGVPTTGLQLIATGHSLVDNYMTFNPDDFALLYKLTGDEHYLDVARLLLHNTKNMLALPGRRYDLQAVGWQQEHWSIAPLRGYGFHRGWLPWVSTSHLNGIFGLMDLDPELYRELAKEQ